MSCCLKLRCYCYSTDPMHFESKGPKLKQLGICLNDWTSLSIRRDLTKFAMMRLAVSKFTRNKNNTYCPRPPIAMNQDEAFYIIVGAIAVICGLPICNYWKDCWARSIFCTAIPQDSSKPARSMRARLVSRKLGSNFMQTQWLPWITTGSI